MQHPAPREFSGYLIGTLAVVVAAILRGLLDPILDDHVPFATFFVAVVIAAAGGLGPAILATVLSMLAAVYCFIPPRYEFAARSGPHLLGLLLFGLCGVIIGFLGDALRRARLRAVHRSESLRVTLMGIGDGVIATDAAGRVTFLNPVAEALTGWSSPEAVGQPVTAVFRIVNESTREATPNPIEQALKLGRIVELANHTILIARDGAERPIDDTAAPLMRDGAVIGGVLVFRDITPRKQAEATTAERIRLTALRADVSTALGSDLPQALALQHCCEAFVRHLGMAFARIWTLNPARDELDLVASAGLYTHLDGPHGRVMVGQYKIGRIASSRQPLLTNSVTTDPNISDPAWAAREGMVAFAGYPLMVDDRVVGVVAMFAPRIISPELFAELAPLAIGIAQYLDRRRAAEQANLQANLHRITLASVADAVLTTDPAGRVVFLNEVAAALTGWSPADAVGHAVELVFDIVGEETGKWVDHPVGRALLGEVNVGRATHLVLIAQDGSRRPIDHSASPISDARGQLLGAVLVFREIGERRRIEENLRISRERLDMALAAADLGQWELDLVTGWCQRTPRHDEIFGYKSRRAEWTYPMFLDHVLPADRPKVDASFRASQESGASWEFECRIRRADGVEREIWSKASVHRNAEGHAVRMLGIVVDVTERKQAAVAVKSGEERLDFVVRTCGIGIWLNPLPLGDLVWNEHVKSHFHMPPDATVTIDDFFAVLDPDDRDRVSIAIDVALRDRSLFDVEYRTVCRQTGAVKWIRAVGKATYDDDGTAQRFDGITLDMTDARRAEHAIREATSRLQSTLAAGDIGTWEFDPVADCVRVDLSLARMFGQAAPPAQGGPVADYIRRLHPDDQPRVATAIERSLASGDSYESEFRIGAGHDARWVAARGRIERDPSGRAVSMPGVVIDISHQKASEAAIARLVATSERERRLFDTVLSNTADFNYTFDLDGRFTYINAALLKLLRKSTAQVLGRTFAELDYPPALAVRLQQQIRNVIATRQAVRDETPYTSAEGERQYEYIFVPVFGTTGAVEAVAGSTRDISEHKRLESELRSLAAELSEASHRKDEFLATLAHELRNPLAPIRNGLHLLKVAAPDAIREQARAMMERQLHHMVRLVDDLLDVSRVSRNKLELRKERIRLSAVVASAVETSRPLLEAQDHELIVELPPAEIDLEADPVRLAQVLANLLNNAAKYTDPGGRITLRATAVDGDVAITVADTGVGIPPGMLPKVFDLFTQIDRTFERSQGGLGIGLTLVRRLVAMHDGTVVARSPGVGHGSEFEVRLPLGAATVDTAPDAAPAEMPATMTRRRILIADDNVDTAESLSLLLEIMGNDVHVVNDGRAAALAAEKLRPDVILLDIGMPLLNGYDTCRAIRLQPDGSRPLIVACTGWGQDDDRRRSREAGFNTHLVKPVDPAALEKLLSDFTPTPPADPE